jgi:hypothetical protein
MENGLVKKLVAGVKIMLRSAPVFGFDSENNL